MENQRYSKAIEEIEEILKYIESQEVDVDVLVEKVKRATELIRFCKSKLKTAEEELHKTLIELEGSNLTEEEPF
ncbi:exodeoxyribonuclease VII small subunit [Candidatus Aerophobetes bacterium]|nr:exodeoxyribonuclease VII small subunit [Candidatus Aerophobetes bacterium]